MTIPRKINFVFGMTGDFGGKPFSLIHYLAVRSAYEVHKPVDLVIYYDSEPTGYWWSRAREFAKVVHCKAPTQIFGIEVTHPVHRTDVLRLQQLQKFGGIYLDLDIICLRPFDDLLENEFVLGRESKLAGSGLCSAVILAEPRTAFARMWLEGYNPATSLWSGYRSAGDDDLWGEMGVQYPRLLADKYPKSLTVVPSDRFYPFSWTPEGLLQLYWGRRADLASAYCVHLWEKLAWRRYLSGLTVDYIRHVDTVFNRIVRPHLEDV